MRHATHTLMIPAMLTALALGADTRPAVEPPCTVLAPIEAGKAGQYEFGKWKYVLAITDPLTHMEGRHGRLWHDGAELTAKNRGDYYCTPWGKLGWWDNLPITMGFHGWVAPTDNTPLKKRLLLAQSARRVEAVKKNVAQFTLTLQYLGPAENGKDAKPYYNITLSVPDIQTFRYDPYWPNVTLKPAEAERLADYLASEGFLQEAMDISNTEFSHPDGPCYVMQLSCDSPAVGELRENLGWNLVTLRRLEGLRSALGDEAAKAMGPLLGRLDEHRRAWEKQGVAPASKPTATQPAAKPTE